MRSQGFAASGIWWRLRAYVWRGLPRTLTSLSLRRSLGHPCGDLDQPTSHSFASLKSIFAIAPLWSPTSQCWAALHHGIVLCSNCALTFLLTIQSTVWSALMTLDWSETIRLEDDLATSHLSSHYHVQYEVPIFPTVIKSPAMTDFENSPGIKFTVQWRKYIHMARNSEPYMVRRS